MTIPKLMHQIYIPPNDDFRDLPAKVLGDTKAWVTSHPDFTHRMWTLDEVFSLGSDLEIDGITQDDFRDLINACRFPAMQADLCRLLILYTLGGFWIDLKLVPKRPFLSEFVDEEMLIIEHHRTPEYPDPAKFGIVNNSFFGCARNSTFIRKAAALAFGNVKARRSGGVWNVTGPKVFMTVLQTDYPDAFQKNYKNIRILKCDDFYEKLVGWGWGSYNGHGLLHWSVRSLTESVYLRD